MSWTALKPPRTRPIWWRSQERTRYDGTCFAPSRRFSGPNHSRKNLCLIAMVIASIDSRLDHVEYILLAQQGDHFLGLGDTGMPTVCANSQDSFIGGRDRRRCWTMAVSGLLRGSRRGQMRRLGALSR